MNKSKSQRELSAVDELLQEKADALLELSAQAEEGELSEDDHGRVESIRGEIAELQAQRGKIQGQIDLHTEIETLGRSLKGHAETKRDQKSLPSLGDQFVDAAEYQAAVASGFHNKWTTGGFELQAATLIEGTPPAVPNYPDAGALVPPDVRPGLMPILYERVTVADLLAQGTTTSNVVQYVEETVADAGSAASVSEVGLKPETRLEFELRQTTVKKIAVFLPVGDDMLEDAAQLRSYINARLTLFIRMEEEDQLLNKTGSGTDIDGLINQVPVANEDVASDAQAPNGADHIFAALTKARESFLEPDAIVVNTDDWADLRLLKDQNDNYIAGSPFSTTGAGEPTETLWNKRTVVTSAITSGTALVGSFRGAAQMFRRGGLTVEASNSHADFFQYNKTAIRCEERFALVVYRPEAFATADVHAT